MDNVEDSLETSRERLAQLLEVVRGRKKVIILSHDNPDPDSVASALALKYLLFKLKGISAVITYGGIIGRAENRAMIRLLRIEVTPIQEVNLRNHSLIATIDTQPSMGNHSLPSDLPVGIVIDHHPLRARTREVPFHDVRAGYGSTSAILTEYLMVAGLKIDRRLASALFYGIKSETRNLGREAADADIRAYNFLHPFTLCKLLSAVENPRLPVPYFLTLERAIQGITLYRDAIIADLGRVEYPDMIAELADLFLRLEGVTWALCLGETSEDLIFSIRTTRPTGSAHAIARRMVRRLGSAGGHGMIAGGRIALHGFEADRREALGQEMRERFLRAIGRDEAFGQPLWARGNGADRR